MKNRLTTVLRKLFTKDTDREVEAIYQKAKTDFDSTSRIAKRHRDLLKKNGVTLQIYIATGEGGKHD